MFASLSGLHLQCFRLEVKNITLDSPELTEEAACLKEGVKSRAGAVFYARPTQGTEVTFETQTSCQNINLHYFDWWLLRRMGSKFGKRPDKEEEEDKEKEGTMQRFED